MTNPLRITADLLRKHNACEEHVAIFEKRWPNGLVPTQRQVPVIVRLRLDVDFAAEHLLRAPAWKAYNEATEPACEAYEESITPAWKAYKESITPARKAYNEATASAFIDAWRMQGGVKP